MKVKTIIYTIFLCLLLYFAISTVLSSNSDMKLQAGLMVADFGLENDRYEWGLSACDWVLEDQPGNSEILKRKADLLIATENYEEAFLIKESFAESDPGLMDADDWETLGGLGVKTGDFEGAVTSYEQALSDYNLLLGYNPLDSELLEKKADLLIKLQRYDEALEVYTSLTETEPDNADAWIGLGDAYLYKTFLTDGQIEDMYKSLDITRPDYDGAESKISSFESHRKAIEAYNKAVEIDPFAYPLVAAKILGGYEKTISSYQDILEGMNG